MDKEIIDLRRRLLAEFFEPAEAWVIVDWLIAAEHRRPVLLVGAGFSRNARHRYRGDYARASEVPLWTDVTRLMATHQVTWNTHKWLRVPGRGTRRRVPRPASEHVTKTVEALRIVDTATWTQVQARFAGRTRTRS